MIFGVLFIYAIGSIGAVYSSKNKFDVAYKWAVLSILWSIYVKYMGIQ